MTESISAIDKLLKSLFPINRSITGPGNRATLKRLKEIIPIDVIEVPSGTKVFDWVVPQEWEIREAWIKDSKGNKVIDFEDSNLHVVSYSKAVHIKSIKLTELLNNLHFKKDLPSAIPYRTSYYHSNWGFCISYNQLKERFDEDETYEVYIDSSFSDGSLSIGEVLINGRLKKEVLISTYFCHPSMANDNLSGVIVTTFLTKYLLSIKESLNFSYRIIFVPETIGAITYCAINENIMKRINNGVVITNCGGPGDFSYKKSFDENNYLNQLVEDTFKQKGFKYKTYPFHISGSDERQYSSQGFGINTVSICKDKYYEFDFYHTSLDDLSFVKAGNLKTSLEVYKTFISNLEELIFYDLKIKNCEVMLSKHNLLDDIGGSFLPKSDISKREILQWLLLYSDGKTSLQEISSKTDIDFKILYDYSEFLKEKGIFVRL